METDGVKVTVHALDDDGPATQQSPRSSDSALPTHDGDIQNHGRDEMEQKELGLDGSLQKAVKDGGLKQKRPGLQREKSGSTAPQPPPPIPPQPSQEGGASTDSLSLLQLKKLVADRPKVEQTPYAFVYEDTSSFEEEVEELFNYQYEEQSCWHQALSVFEKIWSKHLDEIEESRAKNIPLWSTSDVHTKTRFLGILRAELLSGDTSVALMALVHLALGCWNETAGKNSKLSKSETPSDQDDYASAERRRWYRSSAQVLCMQGNLWLIAREVGVTAIYDALRAVYSEGLDDVDNGLVTYESSGVDGTASWAALVLLCLLVDIARRDPRDGSLREQILQLDPDLLIFLTKLLSDLRWSDTNTIPPTKVMILYWKTILLKFGGIAELAKFKSPSNDQTEQSKDDGNMMQITASPLDYHVFRQEITSKYPSFKPPPPLFSFNPGYDSMLPSVDERFRKFTSISDGSSFGGPASVGGRGSSIISQPVHIATPAPSPPPSPAGPGGKGVKKQNYQTNQNFPMLYPPMDESSNNIGGKGSSEVQDSLVARKWQGSDIPCSILEAAEIFSKRMRAGRGMNQLWEERSRFLKYERGNKAGATASPKAAAEQREIEEQEELRDIQDPELKRSLEALEVFYKQILPELQSVVLVLLRVLLQTVTTLVTQSGGTMESPNGQHVQDQSGSMKADPQIEPSAQDKKPVVVSLQDIDIARTQEIMGKACSAILLLFLKWFKLSHVLKFEYMSQLLLDANYLQIILKQFAHQDLEQVAKRRTERKTSNFFSLCRRASRELRANNTSNEDGDDVEDEGSSSDEDLNAANNNQWGGDTELDTDIDDPPRPMAPNRPLTNFSWRVLFSTTNHLRIIQKLIHHKAHRQLLMVQYKSSATLKRCLKMPQPDLRLAALKCIKGQVPYCHRKWRQGNMRIITAIYLHCKPTLRDEWLAGIDVEQELGEAVPQEQALRALTAWFHARRYPPKAVLEREAKESEAMEDGEGGGGGSGDFFAEELDRMDIGREGCMEGEEDGFQTDEDDERWEGMQLEEWLTGRVS